MQLIRKLRKAESGDTIVEILIVLAILGLALSIAYATANKSLQGARQAQEHSEALELVQGQIELLRTAPDNYPDIFDTTKHANGFCMSGTSLVDLTGDLHSYTSYPTTPADKSCVNSLYHLSIKNTADGNDTFTIMALWDDLDGTQDNVSMNYRLHP